MSRPGGPVLYDAIDLRLTSGAYQLRCAAPPAPPTSFSERRPVGKPDNALRAAYLQARGTGDIYGANHTASIVDRWMGRSRAVEHSTNASLFAHLNTDMTGRMKGIGSV